MGSGQSEVSLRVGCVRVKRVLRVGRCGEGPARCAHKFCAPRFHDWKDADVEQVEIPSRKRIVKVDGDELRWLVTRCIMWSNLT